MRMSDRQRRAMFARLNSLGNCSHNKCDRFANMAKRDVSLVEYVPTDDVPDWVTSPAVPRSVAVDKSDILNRVDDFLLQYASNIGPEKRIVGSTRVDDEYAVAGPVELVARVNPKRLKKMDEIFNNLSEKPRIDIKIVNDPGGSLGRKLAVSFDRDTKLVPVPIGSDIINDNLEDKTLVRLFDGYKLTEFDLSPREKRLIGNLYGRL